MSSSLQELLTAMTHAINARNFDTARSLSRQALAQAPQSADANKLAGILGMESGALDEAARHLEIAAKLRPHDAGILYALSELHAALQQWDDMRKRTEQAIAIEAKSARAHMARAQALYAYLQRPAEAWASFLKAYEIDSAVFTTNDRALAADAQLMATLMGQDLAKDALPSRVPEVEPRDDWERAAIESIKSQVPGGRSPPLWIVFFHVDTGDKHPFVDSKGAGQPAIDYAAVLKMACECGRRSNAGARVLILTDSAAAPSVVAAADVVVRLPINRDELMYARMRSYGALAKSGVLTSAVAFLDTDVLINRDLASLFDGGFDVGVTDRALANALMPVNEGVILATRGDSPALCRFFSECLSLYETLAQHPAVTKRYPRTIKHWRGGQLSLAVYLNWRVPPWTGRALDVRGVRVRFFPGEEFNYAVKPGDPTDLLRQKALLHFKGAAVKSAMPHFLQQG